MRLYIAVIDEVPDFIVPTLVAHTILNAHITFQEKEAWKYWWDTSFKKCVISVNRREYSKIIALDNVYQGHENKTLGGEKSCAIVLPMEDVALPNVLMFAKLWKPNNT